MLTKYLIAIQLFFFLHMHAEKKVSRGNDGVDTYIFMTDQNVDGYVDWFVNCHSLFVTNQ